MSAYLITGISGSGKSSVMGELDRRGYTAFDTDELPEITWFYDLATGKRIKNGPPAPIDFSKYGWLWDVQALKKLLAKSPDPTFVGAVTSNSDENFHLFKTIFALKTSRDVLEKRLRNRTTNDFGKHPEELASLLKWHSVSGDHWHSKGAVTIDADQSLPDVVDEILTRVGEKAAA